METHPSGPDPAWNSLYRIGGICLFATGVIYFVATVLTMVVPAPTDAETYLRALATHRRLASTLFTGLALADLLFVPATLALYFALRHLARAAVLLAAAMSLFYAVVDLSVNEISSLAIVMLSRQGDAAAASAQFGLAVTLIGSVGTLALGSAGTLIFSILMLRGGIFGKPTAYAGIAAAITGVVGGFYLVYPPLGLLLLACLIAYGVWGVLAGTRLWRLGAVPAG
jgi:hypothetical protein